MAGLLPLTNVTFIIGNDSVSTYKVDGKIPLNYFVSLDKQNKINKFYFLPYQKEIKAVSMNADEKKADVLVHKVLNLIGHKQVDSAYMLGEATNLKSKGKMQPGGEILPKALL